jgi:hypothetical protein
MKRTILIPTDFSIESLNLFKAAVQSGTAEPVHIVFVHAVYSSASMMELMFSSPRKIHESLITENFRNGCTIIRNKFTSSISSDRIEFFSGITQSAFQNFLEGNGIDEIFIPKNYTFKKASERSFDLMPFIRNSDVETHEVFWPQANTLREKNMLAELFSDSPAVSIH